jgi:hypothetical protein
MAVAAAARVLGCHRQPVLNMIARGEIESMPAAGRIVVSRASVDRVLDAEAEPHVGERPPLLAGRGE